MKSLNKFTIVIDNRDCNCDLVLASIEKFLFSCTTTTETIKDIKTSALEALNNCNKHSGATKIYITVNLYENYMVKITIRDNGCGIDDVKKAREPLFTTKKEKCSGLGFSVMESFCDKVIVKSTLDKGTTVTLSKDLRIDKFE